MGAGIIVSILLLCSFGLTGCGQNQNKAKVNNPDAHLTSNHTIWNRVKSNTPKLMNHHYFSSKHIIYNSKLNRVTINVRGKHQLSKKKLRQSTTRLSREVGKKSGDLNVSVEALNK